VHLAGKVVEHDRGYRAERAEVASLCLIGRHRALFADEPEVIAAAFADPAWVLDSDRTVGIPPYLVSRMRDHLQHERSIAHGYW
jgi:hypothetical protein